MLNFSKIENDIVEIDNLITLGDFSLAFEKNQKLESICFKLNEQNKFYSLIRIAGFYIDIGHQSKNEFSTMKGLNILEKYKDDILKIIPEHNYLYHLANAKSTMLQHKTNNNFFSKVSEVKELNEICGIFWNAYLKANEENNTPIYEYCTNTANILKQQNRITEALNLYDRMIKINPEGFEAWINRSEALIYLSELSDSTSIKMLNEIAEGYYHAAQSKTVPKDFAMYWGFQSANYIKQALELSNGKIDEEDETLTQYEYESMRPYRKWILDKNLGLNEHSLYCKCIDCERDNLTIPTGKGLIGDYIPSMEYVLNRLKSEFGLARKYYYEYMNDELDEDLEHEACLTDLYDNEILDSKTENLKLAFRICFGVLDKIGVAIATLFDLKSKSDFFYFHSFWQLEDMQRLKKFEQLDNKDLVALYSIACDLNGQKQVNGSLAFYKEWRNKLEHDFLVVFKDQQSIDILESKKYLKIKPITEKEFISNFENLMQITRSAIFSFVFAIREKSMKETEELKNKNEGIYPTFQLERKNFK